MKHLFIINPQAGKGKPLKLVPLIKEYFAGRDEQYQIEFTEYPGHAAALTRQHVQSDRYRVYAVGGDGTLNEVLNGIVGSDSSLAVIPAGTGNDFVKTLGRKMELQELLHLTIKGKEKPLDLAVINNRYFINISSVGFDAEVVEKTLRFKKGLLAGVSYLAGVLLTLLRYKNHPLNITVDGESISTRFLLIAVANGRYYGGGFLPTPGALLDDGLLDICMIGKKNIFEIMGTIAKYMKGTHHTVKRVSFLKGKEINISCEKEIAVNIDGEVERLRELNFKIIPAGIKMVVPG